MRISNLQRSNDFITTINNTLSQINKISTQVATGDKIQVASDDPIGTGQLITYNNQLGQINQYSANISTGLSFLQSTTDTMQSVQGEVSSLLSSMTSMQNPSNTTNAANYADQVNQTLNQIIALANTQVNGKYVFGGTNDSTAPYALSADGQSVNMTVPSVSGVQNIMTSSGTSQQINMPGSEVFGTSVLLNGNIDSSTTVGNSVSQSTTVYDASGNPYTLTTKFTKTNADTYSMTYDIVNGSGSSVFSSPPAAQTVVFDPSSGNIASIDGKQASAININVGSGSNQINFSLDPTGLRENSSSSSLNFSANQQTDIFNTLISIRNELQSGNTPTSDQFKAVSNYNSNLLNTIANAGDMQNQLTNSQTLLSNQQNQLNTLMSNIQNVDTAKASISLQTENTLLQAAYQVAASTLTESLVSYL